MVRPLGHPAFWSGSGVCKSSRTGESGARGGDRALALDLRTPYTRYAGRDTEPTLCVTAPYQAVIAMLDPGDSVLVESPVYA